MGVKEVLHTTKHLGWGTDTHLYVIAEAFRTQFPERLQADGPRVLKQNRGNGGRGVWKVELLPAPDGERVVSVLEARRAASRDRSRSVPSWKSVQPISPMTAASSTKGFRNGCAKG